VMTSVLTVGQYYVERYYARGSSRALPLTPLQMLRRNLTTTRRVAAPSVPTFPTNHGGSV
jgi:polar amino acid transport system permease protein